MAASHRDHQYRVSVEWSGNTGQGTANYAAYSRDHIVSCGEKPVIPGSSDPAFRGDPKRWNPEELLVAALSACHQLWYLHLCSAAGITVRDYRDDASGSMVEESGGSGRFTRVQLRPHVTVDATDDVELATRLHHEAHSKCFIANSVNFSVEHEPTVKRSSK